MKNVSPFWDDILEEKRSTRYVIKLDSKSKVAEAIDQSFQVVADNEEKYKKTVLNFCFHIESSLLSIYPCLRSELLEEIGVKAMVQLAYKINEFESVENEFYNNPGFNKAFVNNFLQDFFTEFSGVILNRLEKTSLVPVFTMYMWNDRKGLYLKEFNIKNFLN